MNSFNTLAAVVMSAACAYGATYYVDGGVPTGTVSAKTAGTASFRTIAEAAPLLQAGDRLIVNDGEYADAAEITASGTPDNKIVVRAATCKGAVIRNTLTVSGDNVRIEGLVIDGGGEWDGPLAKAATSATAGALVLAGTNEDVIGVTFSDFTTSASALSCSQGTRVANCLFIRNNQNLATTSDCIIENNEFTDMRGTNTDNVRLFGIKVIMRNNYIHGTYFANTGDSHVDCFQAFDNNQSYSKEILVDGNWCFGDFHQGIMLENDAYNSDYIRDWTVRNNIFCNFAAMAITAGKGSGVPNMNVVNNLFINGASGVRGVIFNGPRGTGVIKNNIFFYVRSNCYYMDNNATCDAANNLLFLSTGPNVSTPSDLAGDPGFTSAAMTLVSQFSDKIWTRYFDKTNFDVSLLSTSMCIDAGTDVSDVTCWADGTDPFQADIVGTARPTGAAFDIGPYEYAGASLLDDADPRNKFAGRVTVDNPARNAALFRLAGAAAVGVVYAKVYDSAGRQVRELWDVSDKAIGWDGMTDGGAAAAPGMYHYAVVTGEKTYAGSFMFER